MDSTCNCGAVRVEVKDDALFGGNRRGHICHCINCRKTAGSAFGTNLMIEQDKVKITGEENMSIYEDHGSLSGNAVRRFFCKTCGNPIKSETKPASDNGMTILKLGIFPDIPIPERQHFFDNRQEWIQPLEGASHWKVLYKPKEAADPKKGDWDGEKPTGRYQQKKGGS